MAKKTTIITIIILFSLSLGLSMPEKKVEYRAPKDVGKQLLDHIVSGFKVMALKGEGGFQTVDTLLQNSMKMLRKAQGEKAVDPVFSRRYQRILEVLKLAIMDRSHDRERILGDHIAREMQNFIYDITGEIRKMSSEGNGIGAISEAVSFELLNLHIYLDTKKNRPELTKKYFRVPPPPPAKKKHK